MTDGWAVVLGAVIALVSGVFAEILRSYLARRNARLERREDFQRDTLLALLDHLSKAMIAAVLAGAQLEKMKHPDSWELPEVITFEENIIAARRFRVLVQDDRVRELAKETIDTAGQALLSGNEADTKAGLDKASSKFEEVSERIGELVRAL